MGPRGAIEVLNSKEIAAIEKTLKKKTLLSLKKKQNINKNLLLPMPQQNMVILMISLNLRRMQFFRVIRALQSLSTKKDVNPPKKHSNIPL